MQYNFIDYKNCPKILIDFMNYLLIIRNYSKLTVREYKYDIMNFLYFITLQNGQTSEDVKNINLDFIKSIETDDVISFLIFLGYSNNYTASSRNRKLASIKTFFSYLNDIYDIDNPTTCLHKSKTPFVLPKYLTLDQVSKVLGIFNKKNSKNSVRNNMIIKTFLVTGCRTSELINIIISDIDFDNNRIRVVGKENKERFVFFDDDFKKELKKYVDMLKNSYNSNEQPLFQTIHKGKRKKLSRRTIRYITNNAYKLAGLEEYHFTTHSLRHTFATILYQNGTDILSIKELLGHSNLSTTNVYSHTTNNKLQNIINNNPFNILKGDEKSD